MTFCPKCGGTKIVASPAVGETLRYTCQVCHYSWRASAK